MSDKTEADAIEEGAAETPEAAAEPTAEAPAEPVKRVPRHPRDMEYFEASGKDLEAMKEELYSKADGKELFLQEFQAEDDGPVTLFGYSRTDVMDLIYAVAYPVIKIIDDRATIKVKSNRAVNDFFVIVQSRRSGTFIGKHGLTLDAVDGLISHTVSRQFPRWVSITVDVDNYRRKRNSYLEHVIRRMIRDIERDHRERKLPGLLPKERKFVHQFFTDHPYLTTESRGKSADRVLYIVPREDIREI